jgi:hypothetical protein
MQESRYWIGDTYKCCCKFSKYPYIYVGDWFWKQRRDVVKSSGPIMCRDVDALGNKDHTCKDRATFFYMNRTVSVSWKKGRHEVGE